MKQDFTKILIKSEATIFEALKVMDTLFTKLLIVIDKNERFVSLLSIGDVQRGILKGESIDSPIFNILRKDVFVGKVSDSKDYLEEIILSKKVEFIPIIDEKKNIVDVTFWKDLTSDKRHNNIALKNVSVVIMAGGKGSRLQPITNIIPKPLVPIGKKAMIHIIMEKFIDFGCTKFYISINYKGEMIKQYLKELNLPCEIHYFEEDKPLGTAGSLSIVKDKIKETFIVSNCDILINQDYEEVLNYHLETKNELTALAALKGFDIPYGVLETKENGQLVSMNEKPSFKFQVNAGVYFLNSNVLEFIPQDTFYNITDLMEDLMAKGKNVGVFPVSEGSWFDIGEWKEYNKTQELFKKLDY